MRKAAEGDLGERFLVDRVVDGLADLRIVERLLEHVHRKVARDDRGRGFDRDVAFLLKELHLFGRQAHGELRFARSQHGRAGAVFDDRLPDDAVKLRQARDAVVRILHDMKDFARVVFLHRVGAGAAGMEGNLAAPLLKRARADHGARGMRELIEEGREGLLEREADRIGVDHFRLGDV